MRVFISYRREDSGGYAGRLCDELSGRFGPERVFRDVVDIAPGADFVKAIDDAMGSCNAVVVLIGERWLDVRDANGRRRLDDPMDYVRRELAAALGRRIPVIPVLIERAVMPAERDLPDELRPFARRNAIELRDAAWHQDAERLIRVIEPEAERSAVAGASSRRTIRAFTVVGALAVAAGVGGGWLALRSSPTSSSQGSGTVTGPSGAVGSTASGAGTTHPQSAQQLRLPSRPRVTLVGPGGDNLVYELRSAELEPAGGEAQMLVLSIRMTNNTGYPQNLWDESFRLLAGGVAHAPVGGLNELIPARADQDGRVVFAVPPHGQTVVLRISALGTSSDISLGDVRPSDRRP